jgi:hypothetical protein
MALAMVFDFARIEPNPARDKRFGQRNLAVTANTYTHVPARVFDSCQAHCGLSPARLTGRTTPWRPGGGAARPLYWVR